MGEVVKMDGVAMVEEKAKVRLNWKFETEADGLFEDSVPSAIIECLRVHLNEALRVLAFDECDDITWQLTSFSKVKDGVMLELRGRR